jgi:hypothetical protein
VAPAAEGLGGVIAGAGEGIGVFLSRAMGGSGSCGKSCAWGRLGFLTAGWVGGVMWLGAIVTCGSHAQDLIIWEKI